MPQPALTPRNIEIRDNFDAIAGRYDLTNRVISFGTDLRWRRIAIRRLGDLPPAAGVLDLACGTCDMALEILRQNDDARVVGADLSLRMLRLAGPKIAAAPGLPRGGARPRIPLVNAPAEFLPFRDASFDAVTIAFGIRNVPDYQAGLSEMRRVLRPGGRACILEFSTPPSRLLWKVYNFYFFNILPRIGGLLTGRPSAYRYLTDSVSRFPGPEEFSADMRAAGFERIACLALYGGIVCVHTGVRA